ncbi:MAG TPA: sensor domain-containing diguanylate cyclase [Noviherbaspirillum sp.]|nr:sensor domain-containing diguanylate cyclase [Noviherbaspirillum sp.]
MSKEQEQKNSVELEKYRRVFHAMPDYSTFSNLRTGVFLDVNPGFERMTGYRREEVIGRSSASIDLWVHAEHRVLAVEKLQSVDAFSIETQFRTRYGDILDVDCSLAVFRMGGEELLVAVVRDITARKRQEQELEQYQTKLEEQVAQRTAQLELAMQKLSELAAHDELTGVGNRRDLNWRLEQEYRSFKRFGSPVSLVVFDIDHFKTINDRHGHAAGDDLIRRFAHIIQHEIRDVDYVARYGGDEFVLLLTNTTAEAAVAPVSRIRQAVSAYPWAQYLPGMSLTTSAGVAEFRAGETADDTFRRADRALYKAKVQGRNQVVVDEGIA